jgi:PAS domain-containing protein
MTFTDIILLLGALGSVSGLLLYLLNKRTSDKSAMASINKTNKEVEQIELDVESKYALQVKKWLDDLEEVKDKHEKELQKKELIIENLATTYKILTSESDVFRWKLEQCGRAHRRLFSDIHMPYWECSQDGKLIYANGAWLRLFGLTQEEALGEGWLRSVPEGDKKRILAEWYSKVIDQFDGEMEFTIVNPITKETKNLKAIYTVKFGIDSKAYKIIGITLNKDSMWLTKM